MEPVMLVVTALVAGAGVGVGNVASTAVMDAYQGLKNLVLGRLHGAGTDTRTGEVLVTQVAASEEDKSALTKALTVAGVDDPTRQAAQDLLDLIQAEKQAKFHTDASQAKGVYIGDGGTQTNNFH